MTNTETVYRLKNLQKWLESYFVDFFIRCWQCYGITSNSIVETSAPLQHAISVTIKLRYSPTLTVVINAHQSHKQKELSVIVVTTPWYDIDESFSSIYFIA